MQAFEIMFGSLMQILICGWIIGKTEGDSRFMLLIFGLIMISAFTVLWFVSGYEVLQGFKFMYEVIR